MNGYVAFWLILAVVFGVIEASTPTLTTIWMAIAALFTAVLCIFDISITLQFLVFAGASAILVALTRPLAKKLLAKKTVPTNADRILFKKGVVIKTIDPTENLGQIKVMGQIWSAKSENDDRISEGTEVVVTRLEGVKVIVEKAENLQTV